MSLLTSSPTNEWATRRVCRDAKRLRTICEPRAASWSAVAERERRHRFRADEAHGEFHPGRAGESGVALRFPPQSKTCWREFWQRMSGAGGLRSAAVPGRSNVQTAMRLPQIRRHLVLPRCCAPGRAAAGVVFS